MVYFKESDYSLGSIRKYILQLISTNDVNCWLLTSSIFLRPNPVVQLSAILVSLRLLLLLTRSECEIENADYNASHLFASSKFSP